MAKKEPNPIRFEIRDARQWDDESISFAVDFFLAEDRPLTVYSCRVVDGKDGAFISFPSRKAKDNKYYSYAYIRLTEDEQDEIIEEVMKTVAANKRKRK